MKRAIKSLRPLTASEAEQLMVYGALDNPTRLIAYEILHDEPDIAFNALARRLGGKTGLAAYPLARLKAAGPGGVPGRGPARGPGPPAEPLSPRGPSTGPWTSPSRRPTTSPARWSASSRSILRVMRSEEHTSELQSRL